MKNWWPINWRISNLFCKQNKKSVFFKQAQKTLEKVQVRKINFKKTSFTERYVIPDIFSEGGTGENRSDITPLNFISGPIFYAIFSNIWEFFFLSYSPNISKKELVTPLDIPNRFRSDTVHLFFFGITPINCKELQKHKSLLMFLSNSSFLSFLTSSFIL